ncbi:SDR family oxidoreductase [Sphingobium nicotianae]|uniref:SDR family oxidoreductase n=1 Tax=Sphingobium nicotianae TaxID=2782607 RepID=A0A9X1D7V4_9SPHN|nr:SDR family oxidoreductase [Sphingobium nicotianae]MBT2185417.1 SDR family oxidoreductase [Sphingobium nicotianae]
MRRGAFANAVNSGDPGAAEGRAIDADFGSPADMAFDILYLASDEAKFVTGSDLVIDGGRMLK